MIYEYTCMTKPSDLVVLVPAMLICEAHALVTSKPSYASLYYNYYLIAVQKLFSAPTYSQEANVSGTKIQGDFPTKQVSYITETQNEKLQCRWHSHQHTNLQKLMATSKPNIGKKIFVHRSP